MSTAEAMLPAEPGRAAPGMKMIDPPGRGDVRAHLWVWAGCAVYALLAIVFIGTQMNREHPVASFFALFGLGHPRNYSVLVLVGGGIALTLVAIRSVFRDLELIRKEEDDVQWVLDKGPEGGAALVLASETDREALFNARMFSIPTGDMARVETMIDDRVRRAYLARQDSRGAGVPVEELRIIAERRTSRFGAFARYASSLLLLLAVLGTFAGVKTALPGLIEAVTVAGAGSTDAAASIAEPLQAVADAFGGNALALIGAISLGLMAHGLGTGRRHLLERLELASAEYVYGSDRSHVADPLQAAVAALQQTAEEIHRSSGAFLGIEGGLESLRAEFKASFGSLDERLSEILHHQESGLYQRTSEALESLQARMSTLAEAVQANTRLYHGFVDRVGDRAEESRHAIAEMKKTSESLSRALESVARLGEVSGRSGDSIERSTQLLVEGTRQVAQQVEALRGSMESVHPAFAQVDASLQASVTRVEQVDDRAAAMWARTGDQIQRQLQGIGDQLSDTVRRVARPGLTHASGGGSELRPWLLVVLPMIGVTLGVGLLYLLERAGVLVQLLFR